MPPPQRAQLPPLKLSVHVFAEDAERRFAIVDGQRVQEGDALTGAIRVRQIQADGVLLEIAGSSWLLPRP